MISTRSDGKSRVYHLPMFEQKIGDFCGSCNSGWMRRLELRAAPILGPMVKHGRPTRLTPQMQETVATWAVKTACVIQRLYPTDCVIPDAEYHAFYNAQQPLPKQVVWIANRLMIANSYGPNIISAKWKPIDRMTVGDSVEPDDIRNQVVSGSRAYRLVFALGQVAFVVFGHTFAGDMRFAMAPVKVIERVWPVRPRFRWPPPTSIDAIGGIERLHDAFDPPLEELVKRGDIK